MKRSISFVMIVITAFSFTVAAQNAKKFYKVGMEFAENRNYRDAVEQFTNALNLDPEYTDAYLARAAAHIEIGELGKALEDCNRAKVFAPKEEAVYTLSGKINLALDNYQESLSDLNLATKFAKRAGEPYYLKAQTLLHLERYEAALGAIDTALLIEKKNAPYNYRKGVVLERLRNYNEAEKYYRRASSEKGYAKPYLALANLKIRNNQLKEALDLIEQALAQDAQNTEAFFVRSQVYTRQLDFPSAINDISKNIILEPDNPEWYIVRGGYYQQFNQHQYAINDFNKLISLVPDDPDAYFMRAKSFEEILDYPSAIKDYEKIATLSEFNVQARKLLADAKNRLFELNRESASPVVTLLDPAPGNSQEVRVSGNLNELVVKGKIKEASDLAYFRINGDDIHVEKDREGYTFLANVNIEKKNDLSFEARDVYDNLQTLKFTLVRTEVNIPVVKLIAPYASDNGEVYLGSNDPRVYVEGKIEDESQIRSIMVEGLNASYRREEINPTFSATIDISNKNKFTVSAEDVYGNKVSREFKLNREGAIISENNPMGKTWVIFIENSKYESFASLDGPMKDVSLMKMALAKYDVHNIIHKKDLSKAEMEKFFSIELRDLVRSNQVNSLLIWYAGHGKFINEVGYWVPVDAQRDDEFTYFNINALKASMQAYSQYITHLLVITDACESGPTFYQAMRSTPREKSCDDWTATKFKSSQVFSSAGYELAVDNSQFTRTFANTLANNPNACLPIENIVSQVTVAVAQNNQQRPKFGKIAGLQDEDGTFFFILK